MRKVIYIFFTAILTFTLWSCSESIMDDINENVNDPTDMASRLIITDVMTSTSFSVIGTDFAFYASVYIEHNVGVYNQFYNAEIRSGEPTSATTYNNPWRAVYETLYNLKVIIEKCSEGGSEEGNYHTLAIAQILSAYNLATLTDVMGDVPWSEALMPGEIFTPKLDNQEDIYPALFTELASAISALNASNPDDGFTNADMIFQGDVEKWRRFGNTLMLRMAMRMSNVAPGLADQYVTQAMQNGGPMQSNDDNVWIPMAVGPSEWTNQNGISRAFYPGDGGNQSTLGQPLVDFLKGADPNSTADDDPRLMIYTAGKFDWTANDVTMIDDDPLNQKGAPPGYYQDEIEVDYGYQFIWDREFSRINYLLLDDDDPYRIMTHSEAAFLMAEALERGIGSGIPGTAEEHYNAGVRSAMQMWTPYDASLEVSDAEVDAYLAQYPYGGGGVTGSESNLEQIGWQFWAAQYLYWYEAWTNWIRSAYPPLVQYTSDQGNVTGGIIPRRLQYPDTEIAINTNFNQASDNNYTSKVWWDVNPDN